MPRVCNGILEQFVRFLELAPSKKSSPTLHLKSCKDREKKRSGLVLPVKERERMGSKSTSWGVEKKEERIQAIKGSTRKKTACYVGGAT